VTLGNTAYEEVVWSNGSINVNTVNINGNIGVLSVEIRDKGCIVGDSVVVTPSCDVLIPIAFSPNGDGINDIFNVLPSNVGSYTLEVYNRWGEKVFSTSSLSDGWSGVYKNELQPVDGYTYYLQGIRLDGEPFQQKGVVMLLR
jgi:gliding motility-associated-like protein